MVTQIFATLVQLFTPPIIHKISLHQPQYIYATNFNSYLKRAVTVTVSAILLKSSSFSVFAKVSDSTIMDDQYPGTAVQRMFNIRERVRQLSLDSVKLNGDWENVRRNILWAGGLKDLPDAAPGAGYTGHSFNDFNHCDLTAMVFN